MITLENGIDDGDLASDTSSTLRQENDIPDVEAAKDKIQTQEPSTSQEVLEKILSQTRSRSSYIDPGPPPDGGLTAWT